MRISTKTRYGMRFMIEVTKKWGQGPMSLKGIADAQGISKKYLEQIVTPLASAGLLRVARGTLGGYELSRDPRQITVADIVAVTEEGLHVLDCTMDALACERSAGCLSKGIWSGLEESIATYLDGITLQDILDQELMC